MLTNAALAVGIETANGFVNDNSSEALEEQLQGLRLKQQTFFAIILWSTFGLAMVRFVGVLVFTLEISLVLIKKPVFVLLHQPQSLPLLSKKLNISILLKQFLLHKYFQY
jgi:hypothetical protein